MHNINKLAQHLLDFGGYIYRKASSFVVRNVSQVNDEMTTNKISKTTSVNDYISIQKALNGNKISNELVDILNELDVYLFETRKHFDNIRANSINNSALGTGSDSVIDKLKALLRARFIGKEIRSIDVNEIYSKNILTTALTKLSKAGNCQEYALYLAYILSKNLKEGESIYLMSKEAIGVGVNDSHSWILFEKEILNKKYEFIVDPWKVGPPILINDSFQPELIKRNGLTIRKELIADCELTGNAYFNKINNLYETLVVNNIKVEGFIINGETVDFDVNIDDFINLKNDYPKVLLEIQERDIIDVNKWIAVEGGVVFSKEFTQLINDLTLRTKL